VFWKKMLSRKKPEQQFINPYTMSEPVTPRYYDKPQFKDGKLIFEKEKPVARQLPEETKEIPVARIRKKAGLIKSLAEVVISDMESLSGITEKRERESEKRRENDAKYQQFLELSGGKK
jgi:hypothetical protein